MTKTVAEPVQQVTRTTTQVVRTVQQTVATAPVSVTAAQPKAQPATPPAPPPLPPVPAVAPPVASPAVANEQPSAPVPAAATPTEAQPATQDVQPEPVAPPRPAAPASSKLLHSAPAPVVAQDAVALNDSEDVLPTTTLMPPPEIDGAVPVDTVILEVHDRQTVAVSAHFQAAIEPLSPGRIHDVPPPDLEGSDPVLPPYATPLDNRQPTQPASRTAVPASVSSPVSAGTGFLAPAVQLVPVDGFWARLTQTGRRLASVIVLPNLAPPG